MVCSRAAGSFAVVALQRRPVQNTIHLSRLEKETLLFHLEKPVAGDKVVRLAVDFSFLGSAGRKGHLVMIDVSPDIRLQHLQFLRRTRVLCIKDLTQIIALAVLCRQHRQLQVLVFRKHLLVSKLDGRACHGDAVDCENMIALKECKLSLIIQRINVKAYLS